MSLIDKILTNKSNTLLLSFLEISTISSLNILVALNEISDKFLPEHIDYFFGLNTPVETKYMLNQHPIAVNPDNGVVFAFLYGYYEAVFRVDHEKNKITNDDTLRTLTNLDGIYSDIRILSDNWSYLLHFVGDDERQLSLNYELSKSYN